MEDTASRILQIIAKSKGLPPESITPESSFDDLQIDSLDKINLTFEIEEVFAISIPDESLNSLRTVQDVITGVNQLLKAKSEPAAVAALKNDTQA